MRTESLARNPAVREEILQDLHRFGPILAEVRFPAMGTAPDWHLLEDAVEFDALTESLGPGVEIHLHRVTDLRNVGRPLVYRK